MEVLGSADSKKKIRIPEGKSVAAPSDAGTGEPSSAARLGGRQTDTDSLRLLFVVDGWFPAMGGAELQALKLAKALRAKGVEIDFVAPHLDKNLPLNTTVEGFRLSKLDYPSVRLLGALWLNMRFAWFALRRRRLYDCMHIHITENLAATAGFLRPLLNMPVITKVSGFYEFEHGVLSSAAHGRLMLRLTRKGLSSVDFVQTISRQTEQKVLGAGFSQEQIKMIPNGIELNRQVRERRWQPGDEFVVGYCGRLETVKGVEILIRGFAGFVQRKPGFRARLRIAGGGTLETQLRALSVELGVEERIEFVGVVSNTDLFLSQCDLYAQPSFAEGLPNSVIEAMNMELAVIASAVGGNRDLVSDGLSGYLFPPGDTQALTDCLLRCAGDELKLAEMGRYGRQIIADQYGFDSVVPKLMKLYRHGKA